MGVKLNKKWVSNSLLLYKLGWESIGVKVIKKIYVEVIDLVYFEL